MEDQASEQVMNFIPGPHSLSAQRAHEHHRLFAGRGPQVLHFRQKNALPRQPSGAEVGKPVGLENEERSTGGGEEAAASPPPGDSPPRGTRFAARRRARFVRPPIPATSLAPRAGPRDARPPLTLPTAPARAPGPGTTTPHRSPRSALRAPGPESPAPPPSALTGTCSGLSLGATVMSESESESCPSSMSPASCAIFPRRGVAGREGTSGGAAGWSGWL